MESNSVSKELCHITTESNTVSKEMPVKQQVEPEKKMFCVQCNEQYKSKTRFVNHMREKHNHPGGLECNVCSLVFGSRFRLNKHMKTHGWTLYHCNKCPAAFKYKDALHRHMLSPIHNKKSAKKIETDEYLPYGKTKDDTDEYLPYGKPKKAVKKNDTDEYLPYGKPKKAAKISDTDEYLPYENTKKRARKSNTKVENKIETKVVLAENKQIEINIKKHARDELFNDKISVGYLIEVYACVYCETSCVTKLELKDHMLSHIKKQKCHGEALKEADTFLDESYFA
jgi:hypothetical protein